MWTKVHLNSSHLLLLVAPASVAHHQTDSWADWTLAEGGHNAVVHAVCFAKYYMPQTGPWNAVSACYLQLPCCQQLENMELTQKLKKLVLLTHLLVSSEQLSSEQLQCWCLRSEQIW